MRTPAFQRPVPRTVVTAAMPFFIVHQPVILLVAFDVVQWVVGDITGTPAARLR